MQQIIIQVHIISDKLNNCYMLLYTYTKVYKMNTHLKNNAMSVPIVSKSWATLNLLQIGQILISKHFVTSSQIMLVQLNSIFRSFHYLNMILLLMSFYSFHFCIFFIIQSLLPITHKQIYPSSIGQKNENILSSHMLDSVFKFTIFIVKIHQPIKLSLLMCLKKRPIRPSYYKY